MELQFRKTICSCLKKAVHEVNNLEQTQEVRLPDSMPDISRILGAWGQVIMRGKEWRSDRIQSNGGIMVWVLYAPEDGSEPRCVDTWIPLQMEWDLPETDREGTIRVRWLPRFVDARSVSPRKIMLRVGVAALAEAHIPMEADVYVPDEVPEMVELLRRTYPVTLDKEAGEKAFMLDEDLMLPASCPGAEKLLYYTVQPEASDCKVMADKLAFRGNANLHVLYRSEEGTLHSCDLDLPFSQFAELDASYGKDVSADVTMGVTGLELELDDEGHLRLKCGLVAQYLIRDRVPVELVEDAYCTDRAYDLNSSQLELPAVLDVRNDIVSAGQNLPGSGSRIADTVFLPDFPRVRRKEDSVEMELPGLFQVLYYDDEGALQSGSSRWEGQWNMNADPASRVNVSAVPAGRPQATFSGNGIDLRGDVQLQTDTVSGNTLPMLAGMELGEKKEVPANRPSVILRRCEQEPLWNLAKEYGSTVAAIKEANRLLEEPDAMRFLLIPVR